MISDPWLTQLRSKDKANPLLPEWSRAPERSAAKERVIARVAKSIFGVADKRPSKGCRALLRFMLSCEAKSLGNILREIELPPSRDVIYGLAAIADLHGEGMSQAARDGIWQFLEMPPGNRLLVLVELRNILERWATSPTMRDGVSCGLAEVRNDLRGHFLPQQWKSGRRKTAMNMFVFSCGFRATSFLGEMAWALKAAQAGNAQAQTTVGYYFGEHDDSRRYLHWTKKAAGRGQAVAMYNLGISHSTTRDGVRKDYKTALKYFLDAEKLGYTKATSEIGRCYKELGDYAKAKNWLDRALSLNSNEKHVHYYLGGMYENGWGVTKSKAIASDYYARAGDAGLKCAQEAAQRLQENRA